ncbi:MAG: 5'/3'-nucleotidase SurE, partial [Gemmataceae bacterium]|nr:5'/3'-nucleotidase SurE [Gemmataceae bacterium]
MRILLTNDDGVYAPGLRALRTELKKLGDVTVVAPAGEQSAVGHSITLLTPLLVQEVLDENQQSMGFAVEGRPADCVKLALLELLKEPPDVVVSGLNAGSNAGINVLYSGTVAAAIEGAFFQKTSIAVSLEYTKPKPLDFPKAAAYARRVIEQILEQNLQPGALFNVNIPSLEKGAVRGIRVVPQNVAPYTE